MVAPPGYKWWRAARRRMPGGLCASAAEKHEGRGGKKRDANPILARALNSSKLIKTVAEWEEKRQRRHMKLEQPVSNFSGFFSSPPSQTELHLHALESFRTAQFRGLVRGVFNLVMLERRSFPFLRKGPVVRPAGGFFIIKSLSNTIFSYYLVAFGKGNVPARTMIYVLMYSHYYTLIHFYLRNVIKHFYLQSLDRFPVRYKIDWPT